jgi:uncharacterized membrane protein
LLTRIAELERLLAEQAKRLERLEHQANASSTLNRTETISTPRTMPISAVARQEKVPSKSESKIAALQGTDLEARIGGRWLNRIGIVVCIFGVAFLIKYAFDNEWIGATTRVLFGYAGGVFALGSGEALRRRGYSDYAYGLTGGGIILLYLATYAAFAFYDLIGQSPAFILMAAVTALAVLLALRFSAQPIAALGLVGGFLTPVLLSSNQSNEVGLFGYMTLLNCGVLALAQARGWRALNHLAFAATTFVFAGWALAHYKAPLFTVTLLFLTIFFLIFAFIPILQKGAAAARARWFDALLTAANSTLYFAAVCVLLQDRATHSQGVFTALLSIFYLTLFAFAYKRNAKNSLLYRMLGGLSLLFLTLAIAIEFDGRWVTLLWTLEGVAGLMLGISRQAKAMRVAALAVLGATVIKIFVFDLAALDALSRIISFLVLGAVLLGVSFLYQKRQRAEDAPAVKIGT